MTDTPAPLYKRLAARFKGGRRAPKKCDFAAIPQTSQDRLCASLKDQPFDVAQLDALDGPSLQEKEKDKTVLYLAYGSNLCNQTFRGARGIRPLSQVNVMVPSLRLTFDLPGLPYTEPCFANTARRNPDDDDGNHDDDNDEDDEKDNNKTADNGQTGSSDYHKNRWHKSLVGVVYEVTRRDYAHIISTEGGGSSYRDILVDCHVLPASDTVPAVPDSQPFKAHTLFAPLIDEHTKKPTADRVTRPDPNYAQPSARYLKLITDGAAECRLPQEYQDYLHGLRPYTITSKRQAVGKAIFLATWLPFVMFIFGLAKKFQDKRGRAPWWYAKLTAWMFMAIWMSYDYGFKHVFGDGERTVGEEALWTKSDSYDDERANQDYVENESLLEQSAESMNLHVKPRKGSSKDWENSI